MPLKARGRMGQLRKGRWGWQGVGSHGRGLSLPCRLGRFLIRRMRLIPTNQRVVVWRETMCLPASLSPLSASFSLVLHTFPTLVSEQPSPSIQNTLQAWCTCCPGAWPPGFRSYAPVWLPRTGDKSSWDVNPGHVGDLHLSFIPASLLAWDLR
jgi:hypothetical protein